MLEFCVFGAGRMGTKHAHTLSTLPGVHLRYVVDVEAEAARKLAAQYGAAATDVATALADRQLDAVIIATPALTHAALLVASAHAGKAIFCEKPLAASIQESLSVAREVDKAGVPTGMGFMKRFEPGHYALHEAVAAGEIGKVEMVVLTNRDPKVTILSLLKEQHAVAPYTLLRESSVHDFDMARWMLGEEPVEVYVAGSALVDAEIAALGEIDTAMITLKTASGALCHINNSWRAVYGYDQRVEVFGSKGMLRAENRPVTSLVRYTQQGALHDPLHSGPPDSNEFFLYRYAEAYPQEMAHFVDALKTGKRPMCSVEDGLRAQLIVEAAVESLRTNRPAQVAMVA